MDRRRHLMRMLQRAALRTERIVAMLLAMAIAIAFPAAAYAAEKRVALVIGNSAYRHTSPLPNATSDAELMARSLGELGFKVDLVRNADQRAMKRALVNFGRELRSSDAVGLFYYAGHGVQVGGRNYLIPVNADIKDETEVGIESISLDEFLATMERAQSRINIVVLDACRNNPYPSAFRSGNAGLARADAPRGTFLAYATSPGSVASDGAGSNSPYTAALSRAMGQPGLTLEQVFKQTRRDVLTSTKGQQTPWETSSITGEFYFRARTTSGRDTPPASTSIDLAFWNSIKDSSNPDAFAAYLEQFPRGTFARLARIRQGELTHKETPEQRLATAPQKEVIANLAKQTPAGSPAAASASTYRALFPDSGQRELSEDEVRDLTCDRLWTARNEMFHRHGYCFTSERGQQVFGNAGCTTTKQDVLNEVERRNSRTIRTYEIRKRCDTSTGTPTPRSATWTRRNPDISADEAGRQCDALAAADFDPDSKGMGIPFSSIDAGEAIQACRRALKANPNERRWRFQLGRAYDKARHFRSAENAYRRAAELGSTAAMVNLGILYEKGQGVKRDEQEALLHYERAASNGSALGAYCAGTLFDRASAGSREAFGRAVNWYERAVTGGHQGASRSLRELQQSKRPTGSRCD